MKYFAQFMVLGMPPEQAVIDLLGSDGVYVLDGRKNVDTLIYDTNDQMKRLENIHPEIVGFVIYQAKRFSSHISPRVHEFYDHDKIAILRKKNRPFDEDKSRRIPLNEIDFIEMDSTMTKYQVHLLNPEDRSFKVIREYRGTKGIKFEKDYLEIR